MKIVVEFPKVTPSIKVLPPSKLFNISMTLFLNQIIILTVVTTHRNEPYRIANFSFKKGLIEKCVFILKNRLIAIFYQWSMYVSFKGKNYISDIETDKCYD